MNGISKHPATTPNKSKTSSFVSEEVTVRLPWIQTSDRDRLLSMMSENEEEQAKIQRELMELRHRLASLEESTQLSRLQTRFKAVMYPNNESTANLAFFWVEIGGASGWKQCLSPKQLDMLLAEDQRWEFRLPGQLRHSLADGFVELVLSRLPEMHECTLEGLRCPLRADLLKEVAHPFPHLTTLNMRRSALDDAMLLALVRSSPRLALLDARECRSVTWAGMEAARQARAVEVATGATHLNLLPATAAEKATEDAKLDREARWLNYSSDDSEAEYAQLLTTYGPFLGHWMSDESVTKCSMSLWQLWRRLGGRHSWQDHISPVQLTLLLSREKIRTVLYTMKPHENIQINGEQIEAVLISPEEGTAFFTEILSRLPELKAAVLYECSTPAFDVSVLEQMDKPFPTAGVLAIRCSPCRSSYLIRLCKALPSLGDDGVRVDVENVIFEGLSRTELKERCGGTLTLL